MTKVDLSERLRMYEEAKRRLPKDLTFAEYESAVKELIKKFKI